MRTANAGSLTIRRWRAEYLVPSTHPAPGRVRDRYDTALREWLPHAGAEALRRVVDEGSDECVFVRRLDLDLVAETDADRDAIAALCAQALGRSLAAALAANDASNVVRFASRAEYVARYIADVAAGGADRWYYHAFAGFRALPASAAVRSVLVGEGDIGVAALRCLAAADLMSVIDTLGTVESARVLDAWSRDGAAIDIDAAVMAVLATLAEPARAPGRGGTAGSALWLFVRSGLEPGRASGEAAQAIAALLAAEEAPLRALPGLASGVDIAAQEPLRRARGIVAACSAATRDAITQALAAQRREQNEVHTGRDGTRRGGAFLLFDSLFRLPLAAACADWPDLAGTPASNLLHFIVLSFCAGADDRRAFAADPFWRRRFGIAPVIAEDTVQAWLASAGRHRWLALARALTRDASPPTRRIELPRGLRARVDAQGLWRMLGSARIAGTTEEKGEGEDLAWLLGNAEADPWACLFVVAAQQTLRRFAACLPGFGASHFAYVQRNFLDVGADVEEGERIVVRLSRPPLALILNLAGHTRGERHWPLVDARPHVLSAER